MYVVVFYVSDEVALITTHSASSLVLDAARHVPNGYACATVAVAGAMWLGSIVRENV
jgi:hypothetical protein